MPCANERGETSCLHNAQREFVQTAFSRSTSSQVIPRARPGPACRQNHKLKQVRHLRSAACPEVLLHQMLERLATVHGRVVLCARFLPVAVRNGRLRPRVGLVARSAHPHAITAWMRCLTRLAVSPW